MTRSSWATSEASRAVMRGNRSRDTKPELALRSAVHRLGLRYRVDTRPLPDLRRTADLVFTRTKVAVFVDGCFWHGCPQHHVPSRSNVDYWSEKVAGNRARDADTDAKLIAAGWTVLRFWAHVDVGQAAAVVEAAVHGEEALPRFALDALSARVPSMQEPTVDPGVARQGPDPQCAVQDRR